MQQDIISLQETSANHWEAKYHGNHGIYKIKITLDDNQKASKFSCSCPSDYHPCKHISMILTAIKDQMKNAQKSSISISQVIHEISHQELIAFIEEHAQYNQQLSKAILLEFTHKIQKTGKNNYNDIIRKELETVRFDYEDLYDCDYGLEIDALDDWNQKAEEHLARNNFSEAIAIAQAFLEEFAVWVKKPKNDFVEYVDELYFDYPFVIFKKAAEKSDVIRKELYQYLKSEMVKNKYKDVYFSDNFNDVLQRVIESENADDFIAIQDKLFRKTEDKSSWEAEKILNRKIAFYEKNKQFDEAWNVIVENIQIKSFRMDYVKKKIQEKQFSEAKTLIHDFINLPNNQHSYKGDWWKILLDIAQKEQDIPTIRSISYKFLSNEFDKVYYRIYKATFSPEKWNKEAEKLIKHYIKNTGMFYRGAAHVMIEENDIERLKNYIKNHVRFDLLEEYYKYIHQAFPEETLTMFRKTTDYFLEQNMGRDHYEYVVNILMKMKNIKNGQLVVQEMLTDYRLRYKNRRAMLEIFSKL